MKPKDALLKDGFPGVKAGKGRLSAAAKDRCQYLVDNKGYLIDGYVKSSTDKATGEPADKPKPLFRESGVAGVAAVPDERFPEASYRATLVDAAGKVGMRDVCNGCGNSFVYHWCSKPSIYRNLKLVTVKIVPVKS